MRVVVDGQVIERGPLPSGSGVGAQDAAHVVGGGDDLRLELPVQSAEEEAELHLLAVGPAGPGGGVGGGSPAGGGEGERREGG